MCIESWTYYSTPNMEMILSTQNASEKLLLKEGRISLPTYLLQDLPGDRKAREDASRKIMAKE